MAKESAKKFVEKFYTDDEFLKKFCKNGGVNKKANDQEKTKILLKTSKDMGYDFTEEEYKNANAEYFKDKGIWNFIKSLVRIKRLVKEAEKEKNK